MKNNYILIICLLLLSMKATSQEGIFTLSGGYSFANIKDADIKGTGWRINGLFEMNPMGGKIAHGLSIGYINVSGTKSSVTSTIGSIPIYYAPKVMFGNEKFKGFIKGALGMQYSTLKREGLVSFKDDDFGFYGGGGAGFMIFLKENIFLNGEYEIAWLSNSFYQDGWMNTVSGGIGFKF
jgi:hypothetical protein